MVRGVVHLTSTTAPYLHPHPIPISAPSIPKTRSHVLVGKCNKSCQQSNIKDHYVSKHEVKLPNMNISTTTPSSRQPNTGSFAVEQVHVLLICPPCPEFRGAAASVP